MLCHSHDGNKYNPTSIKLRRDKGSDDWRNFEPKRGLTFSYLDKIIPKLRAMHKEHPEWFEIPKLKSSQRKKCCGILSNRLALFPLNFLFTSLTCLRETPIYRRHFYFETPLCVYPS